MIHQLISQEYVEQQKWLHKQPRGYGGRGDNWGSTILQLIGEHKIETILDYGCGQGSLGKYLYEKGFTIREFDPAIKGKDEIPQSCFDLVICTDVLEHIEPDKLDANINLLFEMTKKILFIVIATRPSNKILKDGRNAHLIIKPEYWWKEKITNSNFQFVKSKVSVFKEYVAVLKRND